MNHIDPRTTLRSVTSADYTAANDDSGPSRTPDPRVAHRPTAAGGWDAFEIWRTRVRDARRDAPPPRRG
jgi:hypothetical protein